MRDGTSTTARLLRRVDPDHRPSMAALRSSYRMHRSLGTNRWMLRRALPEMMPAASLEPAMSEALLADAGRLSPEAVVGFLQALHRWNVEAELPGLRVTTTILWGAKDEFAPVGGGYRFPSAELVVWPDAGHSPQLERPDAFVALLAPSARRLLARRLRLLLGRAKRWCAAALQA